MTKQAARFILVSVETVGKLIGKSLIRQAFFDPKYRHAVYTEIGGRRVSAYILEGFY